MIAYLSRTLPFTIWLLMGFIQVLPKEIEDAARIDGCNNFDVFRRIIMPLLTPAIPAAAMFAFILSWNEFLYAMIMISTDSKRTLPIAFYGLRASEQQMWGPMLAWLSLIVIPPLIFYLFFYKKMTRGLTAGAVKE
jgi:multiple sugar transport system permease protein